MNDHRDHRRRAGEPAWPTGDDPDAANWPKDEPQERTGFWSPLWDDDDERPAVSAGAAKGAKGRARNGQHANGGGAETRRVARPPAPAARPRPPAPVPPGAATTVGLPAAGMPRRPPRPGQAPGPRDNSQDPTDLLPPVPGVARREPDLLTHREPDYEAEDLAGDDYDDDGPLTDQQRRKRRKKIWRRIRRTMYTFIALLIIVPVLAFFIAYQFVEVPNPVSVAADQNQAVTIQYADGSELARIAPEGANRTMVKYGDIPRVVLDAVYAAEDKDFETNAGFDLTGVMRAGWNQVSGDSGGGSTITQQYIKKATGDDEKTVTRKALEVVKAYKMNNTYSKPDIITAYLNTVYIGRNAYGIAAAVRSYYGKELKDVTISEAALLAGMIQSPSRFKDDAYMQRRWNFVMDQLVANGKIPDAQRKSEQFPTPVPYEQTKNKALTGPRGLIQGAVFDELENGPLKLGEDDIQLSGFTIVTTIDKTAQDLAEQAVAEVMEGQPENLAPALVAVDPETGEIKAYYGGKDGVGTDWAAAHQEPGSAFKPFDLVALLEKGKGLGEVYDGSSPRSFRGVPRRNSENAQCNPCTVAEAMKRSINTVFFDITLNTTSAAQVAEAARQAGITSPLSKDGAIPTDGIAIGGDDTQVSTVEMASAYATFAARGMHRTPHLVAKVLNPDGSTYWQATGTEKRAFDSDARQNEKIARNVTESLLPVPGFSKIPCADNRLCAGKTGTHQLGKTGQNSKAWMVGYTPQISTAVSLSAEKGAAIEDARGGDIFGARVPGKIWKKFMDSYHKEFKLPKEDFGRFDPIGKKFESPSSSTSRKPPNSSPPTSASPTRPTDPPEPTRTRPRPTRPTIPTFPTFNPALPAG